MAVLPSDHVIVLCHGFLGFQSILGLRYFNHIVDNPNMKGNHIIVPEVSMFTHGIEVRAKQLNEKIKLELQKLDLPPNCIPKLHFIGHSMGGLDARRIACAQEEAKEQGIKPEYEVLSITTVGTPHYGTPASDFTKSIKIAGYLILPIVSLVKSLSGAIADMAPERMESFNQKYPDVPTVKYYSIASTFTPGFFHLLFFTHRHIKNGRRTDPVEYVKKYDRVYGENDGLVSYQSAQWGVPLDLIDVQTSHLGLLGWGSLFRCAGDKPYAAGDKLYPKLVDNIARNVVGI